ncbi:MAG: thiamine diphosphokinase [Dethiobacteria bacterium]|jgi:thiamine pyrophosphokinase
MHVYVIANGNCDVSLLKELKKNRDDKYIICADGGAALAVQAGLIPDLLIGDFDSLSPIFLTRIAESGSQIKKFPVEKDETDTELAIKEALTLKIHTLTLLGGWGSRWDHSLSNINLLAGALKKRPHLEVKMMDQKNELWVANKYLEINGQKGDPLSLLPYSHIVSGVTTSGLYYPLTNARLYRESTLALSNYFLDNKASISIDEGILLVMRSRD